MAAQRTTSRIHRHERARGPGRATRRALALALVGLPPSSCAHPASEPARPLFDSRVALAPLRAELRAAGGDPARLVRPAAASDLDVLVSGGRYKFVVLRDGRLVVAPVPADAPGNAYTHPILADGQAVLAAGGIRIERSAGTVTRIVLDQNSRAYCPTPDSLDAARGALGRLGFPADRMRVENRPPACLDDGAPAPSAAAAMSGRPASERPRYGNVMLEVGRRFELFGKAARAARNELAAFELGELGEIFADDLPRAEPPRESAGVDLPRFAEAFRKANLPDLEGALQAHDGPALTAAVARAAAACNACHQASGHRFIEVPGEPGASVPKLDGGPPPAAPRR